MADAGVPTAGHWVATHPTEVAAVLDRLGPAVRREARRARRRQGRRRHRRPRGRAGARRRATRVVIEEYLDGPEVSLFCLTDGDDGRAAGPGAGLQAGRRRRHRSQHRRHGRVRAAAAGRPPGWSTRSSSASSGRRSRRWPSAGRRSPACSTCGLALTSRGTRRSWSSTSGSVTPRRRRCSRCSRRRWRAAATRSRPARLAEHPPLRWRRRRRGHRRRRRRRLPGRAPRTGDEIEGLDDDRGRRRPARRDGVRRGRPAGHERRPGAVGDGSRPGPGGCERIGVRGGATPSGSPVRTTAPTSRRRPRPPSEELSAADDRALHASRDGRGLERGPQVRAVVPGRDDRPRGACRGRHGSGRGGRAGAPGARPDPGGGRRGRGRDPARRHRVPHRRGPTGPSRARRRPGCTTA